MKISAVIFDMDGLMFDTERLGYFLWKEAIKSYGYNLTDEIYFETVGVNIKETEKILKKYLGENLPFEDIYKKKIELTEKYIEEKGIPIKEGLLELINFLDEKRFLEV